MSQTAILPLEGYIIIPGSSKNSLHRNSHRYIHYPATLNFHVVLGSAERHEQKLLFFFEGRQTHNSEYNIELGDGAP